MIISKNHLKRFLKKDFTVEELSASLFQLGHENEIFKDLIDIEITPNRGDCLSLFGLARDLNNFYKLKEDIDLIKTDPIYAEQVAHEKGYARENETIFYFPANEEN